MKRIVSILLIGLLLLQTSDISFDDIIKVKNLYEHASYHKKQYGDSFWQFLSEHYGNKTTQHQNKHKEHKNLPLKHVQDGLHINASFTTYACSFNLQSIISLNTNAGFFYQESYTFHKKISIFQPPRFA